MKLTTKTPLAIIAALTLALALQGVSQARPNGVAPPSTQDSMAMHELTNTSIGDLPDIETPAPEDADAQKQTLYVTANPADLYVSPEQMEAMPAGFTRKDLKTKEVTYDVFGEDQKAEVVLGANLGQGETVLWSGLESSDGEWLQVEYHGMQAWVKKSQLTKSGWAGYDPAITQAFNVLPLPEGQGLTGVAELAQSRVGDQYVWGGSAPGSFDCSGLMQWAYRNHGINIPRVSRDQQAAATPISADQLQSGDLVFTGNPVKHVMMYTGDGQLVEAMGRKWGVVNSSLGRRTGGGKAVYYGTFRDQIQ
jgi:cell wall-associated NlpC family hydrolase